VWNGDLYWDGGMGCNSPGVAAIDLHRSTSGLGDSSYALLDLGTGTDATGLSADDPDLGFMRILSALAATFLDANESVEEGEAAERFGSHYVSLLGEPTGMDSVDDATVIPRRIADGLATDISAVTALFNQGASL
jgi:hypothetical protein